LLTFTFLTPTIYVYWGVSGIPLTISLESVDMDLMSHGHKPLETASLGLSGTIGFLFLDIDSDQRQHRFHEEDSL
jgi:hypothetical protein